MKAIVSQRMNTNLSYCNFIRTCLMVLVVLGHSCDLWMGDWFNQSPITENNAIRVLAVWLNSFHTYAFTLLSGYLFYYLKYEKGKYSSYLPFVKNKVKRLLVPYIFVSIIWVAPVYAYFYKTGLLTMFRRFVLCEGPSQLWFLIMLFGVFLIFYPLADFMYSHTIYGCIIVVVLFGISIIGDHLLPNYFQIWTICGYIPFFWTGFVIRKRESNGKSFVIPIWGYFMADMLLLALYLQLMSSQGTLYRMLLYGEGFALHIVGSILAFRVLGYVGEHIDTDNKWYKILKDSSMGIYLFHQQIIFFIIDCFNGKVNPWLLV